VCLDVADVVRDEPIILCKKIEELRILGAFLVGVSPQEVSEGEAAALTIRP
jgi:hypothetical protein